jgi:CheY-like chemotaxis protein
MPSFLLIENSEDHAILFQRTFAKVALHWQQVCVKDGTAAVHHMLFNGFPDLLVTAMETPRLDAVDVVEWVRSMKSPRTVPVLIYDRVPSPAQCEKFASLGVRDYLDKRSPGEKFRTVLTRLVATIEVSTIPAIPAGSAAETARLSMPGFARRYPQ